MTRDAPAAARRTLHAISIQEERIGGTILEAASPQCKSRHAGLIWPGAHGILPSMRTVGRRRVGLIIVPALAVALSLGVAEAGERKPAPVPAEEYPIYDLVVRSKYLVSGTTLVLIERLTAARVEQDEREYLSREFLEEQGVFGGALPAALLDDFLVKLKTPSRLEAKFGFGVQYRFFSGGVPEEPEVSLAPVPAASAPRPAQEAPHAVGVLRFSRVGFTPREDQALVYVEEERPDGAGGGLLVWLHRRGKVWTITDTEVLWMARTDEEPGQESP